MVTFCTSNRIKQTTQQQLITQKQPNNTDHPATTDKTDHHTITRLTRRQLEMTTISTSNSKMQNSIIHISIQALTLAKAWVEFHQIRTCTEQSSNDDPRKLVRAYPMRMRVERCHSACARAINSSSAPDLNNRFMLSPAAPVPTFRYLHFIR